MNTQKEMDKHIRNWVLENLANFFTFFRLFGSIWILVIAIRNPEQLWKMIIIAALVVLSDLIDGKIARKFNLTSHFGAALDQLGDKFFVVPGLVILSWRYRWMLTDVSSNLVNFAIALMGLLLFLEILFFVAWWVLFIVNKIQIHSNRWAKCKTFSMFPLVIVWLISIAIERDFKIPVVQNSIYLIVLGLILADIFGCAALKAYYQGYFKLEKVKEVKEEKEGAKEKQKAQ